MALPNPQRSLTEQEYLERERAAEFRSEFFQGEMFAMAGGTPHHSQIALRMGAELLAALEPGPCVVYESNLRVKVEASGLYTYPDLSVSCETPRFVDDTQDTLLNPTVLVEVLSESTEGYDRGRKFEMYRRIPSLREYILVSQWEPRIESFVRQGDGTWLLHEAVGPESSFTISSLGVTLSLARVYAKVDFSRVPPRPVPPPHAR